MPARSDLHGRQSALDNKHYIADIANMTNMQDVSTTLRAIRVKLNLTQQQLAEQLGVSFATVNRWEGGTTPQKAAREVIAALATEAGVGNEEDGSTIEPAAGVT